MMDPSPPRIPDVFVLWHPTCSVGESLAREIHKWLRPGKGLGPEVFYRSLSAPDGEPGALPIPIPGEPRVSAANAGINRGSSKHVNEQILIPLIDDHMVADPAWRYWLAELAANRSSSSLPRTFMPVALDSTAYNVPPPIRELNFLRPTGLPINDCAEDQARSIALAQATRSLLKQLTEALCKHFLGSISLTSTAAGAPGVQPGLNPVTDTLSPKISLFLSHAKADGTTPARRIRDYIYSQTQLAAFYDENDIPFGSAFSRVLESSIQSSQTAALIAVRSARYANRPWCRRELSLFRRPRLESSEGQLLERWRLQPMLVVDALEHGARTDGIPETGNATLIRWSDDVPGLEEEIVTTILRDALLAAFHSSLGSTIASQPHHVVLNWLPDPTTLLHIPAMRDPSREVTVVYPGRGLSGLELDTMGEYFPQVIFRSFDQAKP